MNGFSCTCLAGYTGILCEINYNECGSSPCRNGGICADGVNAYLCVCKAGYTGQNCEVDIDDCQQAPCKNGGKQFSKTILRVSSKEEDIQTNISVHLNNVII